MPENLETVEIKRRPGDDRWGFSCLDRKDYEYPIPVDYLRLGGPADVAGLKSNDVIWTINGKDLNGTTNVECFEHVKRGGDTILLGVERYFLTLIHFTEYYLLYNSNRMIILIHQITIIE